MAILASTIISTEFGPFRVCFHKSPRYQCVSFSRGNLSKGTPLVRIHSACLFGEAFHSLHCDCDYQLAETMKAIRRHGSGVIVYAYQEGRGIGLLGKIKAMEIQRLTKCDTIKAFKKLGYKSDLRDYRVEVRALKDLALNKNIVTLSGNPQKSKALEKAGYRIKRFLKIDNKHLSKKAKEEMRFKIDAMGFTY